MFVRNCICTLIAMLLVFAFDGPVRGQADLGLIGLSYGTRIEFFRSQTPVNGSTPLATQTWDGGGVTNNWSEAANWTNDQLPTTAIFDGTSTKNAIIDISLNVSGIQILSGYTGTITMAPGVNVTFGDSSASSQASGTFNAGSGTLIFGNLATGGGLNLSGGTFNAGSAQMMIHTVLNQTGGTFNAGTANITVGHPGFNAGSFNAQDSTIQVWGDLSFGTNIFNSDGGNSTVLLYSTNRPLTMTGSEVKFKNLTISKDEGHRMIISDPNRTVRVTGTLTLTEGGINASGSNSVVKAEGPVNIGPTFGNADDGNPNNGVGGDGTVLIKDGPAGRAIDWPATAALPHIRLDDPNVTLTVTGTALARSGAIALTNGTIDVPAASLKIGHGASTTNSLDQANGSFHVGSGDFTLLTGSFRLTGGTFTMDSGNATFPCFLSVSISGGAFNASSGTTTICSGNVNGQYTQTGGVVNAGTGTFAVGYRFTLNNGTFNTSSGITRFGFVFEHLAGTFSAMNGGTVVFQSTQGVSVSALAAGTQFNNVNIAPAGDHSVAFSGTPVVNGDLNLVNGFADGAAIQVKGNVIVNATADGGTAPIVFNGSGAQSFTNNGGPNTTGTWTVNNASGILTAATDMILGTAQPLNITAGTLYLANGSDLTAGAINIGASGKLANDSSTTITLGANAVNNGRLDLQGGGAACPEPDTILLRSSVAGTRRNWSGTGLYRISDVDVKDMGGVSATTPAITVFSGTDSGNNNTNWTFNPGCAPQLTISPLTANVSIGGTQQFTGGGGFGSRTFSIPVNNSGGTINASTGLYTAGTTSGVTDTVRVTDSFGTTADAAANVIGTATRVAFVVQPSNAVAGQTITPSIQVAVQDAAGNTVTNAANSITLAIFDNPGGGMLSGTVTRNAIMGIATFDNLSINRSASGYTLQATSTGLTSATSSAFNISAGAPARLGFVTQPSNTDINSTIVPPIQVAVQDTLGNTVPTANNFVSLVLENNPGGAAMSGTSIRQAVSGVAAFDDISLNRVADGYSLRAQAAAPLTDAVSVTFNITRPIFVVTNTNDSGNGSLRQAITNANALAGLDAINFNIPGPGPFSIMPISALPPIVDPVVIDGSTQPGYAGTPIVEINGAQAPNASGLTIRAGGTTIKGLVINRFAVVGIKLETNGGNIVQGNYIGTNVAGTAALGNGGGIHAHTSNNLIGGLTTAARNLISGNTLTGIQIAGSGNVILGNYIGTNAAGSSPLPNGLHGIAFVGTGWATIGGTGNGEGNLIAFNGRTGIYTLGRAFIRGNSIHGNGQLGIDSQDPGVATNDWLDTVPPQNNPELRSATFDGSTLRVSARLTGPEDNYEIHLYSSPACDAAGSGEGRTYLGSGFVSIGVNEYVKEFAMQVPASVTIGHVLTATATSFRLGTSEFSQCRPIAERDVSISGRAVDNNGAPLPNTLLTITGGRTALTNSNGDYSFDGLLGGFTYTVSINRPNYSFTPPSRTYNTILTDQTNQNFTGVRTRFSIAGMLTRPTGIGSATLPLSEVTLTLSGPVSRTVTASSIYSFTDLPPGNYVVTPSKFGFAFTPPSSAISISSSDRLASFSGASTAADGRIIFSSSSSLGIGSINADGSAYAPGLFGEGSHSPSISSDGKKIVFGRKAYGPSDGLYVSNADGSGQTRIAAESRFSSLEWSPNGTKIAAVQSAPINQSSSIVNSISIYNADGSGVSTFSMAGLRNVHSVSWLSASRLAFAATASGSTDAEIFAVNSDGSGLAQLTNNDLADVFPSVSPDGLKIAYRRSPGTGTTASLFVMNSDGSNQVEIRSDMSIREPNWSPDGSRIVYTQASTSGPRLVSVNSVNGSGLRVIRSGDYFKTSWGPDYAFETPAGSNTTVDAGGATVVFANVSVAGSTAFTPLAPTSVGIAPSGYTLSGRAYDIATTATYASPLLICVKVPTTTAPTQIAFNALSVMQNDAGMLVDRTVSRSFASRSVCAQASELGSFVLAEQLDATSPDNGVTLPSITGLVVDAAGVPLPDVLVQLDGTETRTTTTDFAGAFRFVNLTQGGRYHIRPRLAGYLFSERSMILTDLAGDNGVAFIGTAATFSIGGKVRAENGAGIEGIAVSLDGSEFATTDANGDYIFPNIPADGVYTVIPSGGGGVFDPRFAVIDRVSNDVFGIDFVQYANAPPAASIGGRTVTIDGDPISRVFVSLVNAEGQIIQTATSNPFGFYVLSNVPTGQTYSVLVSRKGYEFPGSSLEIFLAGDISGLDFIASP